MKTDSDFSDSADEQAALWASRLDGSTLSASDREALDLWLAKDPAHRELLASYCQFSADLEDQLPQIIALGLSDLEAAAPKAATGSRILWLAGFGLAAALAIAFLPSLRHRGLSVETPVGQRQSLTLEDGTRVELNARTALKVTMGPSERHVTLSSGEAYFQVSKNPSRPFFVDTPAGSVRVTGTMFDVKTDAPGDLAVSVVEGSVLVSPADTGTTYHLKPGDALEADRGKVSVAPVGQETLEDTLAWRTGEVVFHGLPLDQALAEFARYHGTTITVSQAAHLAGFPVGGRFSLDDLSSFLSGLPSSFPVRVTHREDGSILVSLKSEP